MAKLYGLANQKLCYIQMLLNIEKSREQGQERSEEWLMNTDPGDILMDEQVLFDNVIFERLTFFAKISKAFMYLGFHFFYVIVFLCVSLCMQKRKQEAAKTYCCC